MDALARGRRLIVDTVHDRLWDAIHSPDQATAAIDIVFGADGFDSAPLRVVVNKFDCEFDWRLVRVECSGVSVRLVYEL